MVNPHKDKNRELELHGQSIRVGWGKMAKLVNFAPF